MRRTALIIGIIAALLTAALAAALYWITGQLEDERNKSRTAAARGKRWPDPGAEPAAAAGDFKEEEDLTITPS